MELESLQEFSYKGSMDDGSDLGNEEAAFLTKTEQVWAAKKT